MCRVFVSHWAHSHQDNPWDAFRLGRECREMLIVWFDSLSHCTVFKWAKLPGQRHAVTTTQNRVHLFVPHQSAMSVHTAPNEPYNPWKQTKVCLKWTNSASLNALCSMQRITLKESLLRSYEASAVLSAPNPPSTSLSLHLLLIHWFIALRPCVCSSDQARFYVSCGVSEWKRCRERYGIWLCFP